MQDLFSVNPHWFSGILRDMSDAELKEVFDILQKFYTLCDSSEAGIYYELFDLLENYIVQEIVDRFFRSIA